MMPYIQGDPDSVPDYLDPYREILETTFMKKGDVGFLTVDESPVSCGNPHRGARARFGRALHTEAGRIGQGPFVWGSWGGSVNVTLDPNVRVLIASNVNGTCAVWDTVHHDTTPDGDIGHLADLYPYEVAKMLGAGEVEEIGILTPHESLPVDADVNRQFLRLVSSGVYEREPHFTVNPLLASA